ncbi:MAG: hypothetical protein LBL27_04025, partial [Coriobacteriales bacterium]|nr:hypothetical protein [Coriobacteriales bacterium]
RARYFGDLDQGIDSFEGPAPLDVTLDTSNKKVNSIDYEACVQSRAKLKDAIQPFSDSDVYHLPDVGNEPSIAYILRGRTWQGSVPAKEGVS